MYETRNISDGKPLEPYIVGANYLFDKFELTNLTEFVRFKGDHVQCGRSEVQQTARYERADGKLQVLVTGRYGGSIVCRGTDSSDVEYPSLRNKSLAGGSVLEKKRGSRFTMETSNFRAC